MTRIAPRFIANSSYVQDRWASYLLHYRRSGLVFLSEARRRDGVETALNPRSVYPHRSGRARVVRGISIYIHRCDENPHDSCTQKCIRPLHAEELDGRGANQLYGVLRLRKRSGDGGTCDDRLIWLLEIAL